MIICFANQKGGVGKTTHSVNFSFECCIKQPTKRTLLVDADLQRSIMKWSDKREISLPNNLSIIGMAKKTLHRDILAIAEDYDFVIIDSPGRFTDIARSVLLASDIAIIPCTPSSYDTCATQETTVLIEEVRIFKPLICYFLINRKIANTTIGREITEELAKLDSDIILLESTVCQRVSWAKSSQGLSIQELKCDKAAEEEMSSLWTEVMVKSSEERLKITEVLNEN